MQNPPQESDADSGLQQAAWFLAGQLGPEGGIAHIAIKESPFTIGRNHDKSLCLPVRTVSGFHAEIRLNDEGPRLRDVGSTNGTFLNGQRVQGELPLKCDDLVQFADIPLRVCRQQADVRTQTIAEDVYDQAVALVQFDKLMSERQVTPFYQPVVELRDQRVVGYEVLGRSPLFGVATPNAMFRAAAKLNLEVQLSRVLRWEGILQSEALCELPHLFVNTHPAELTEPGLGESLRRVREINPHQPLTLEIHEGAVTGEGTMAALRAELTDMNVALAYDDFGSGRARLAELVNFRPEYVKFDISLIHGIDTATAQHQQMVASLVNMVRDLGIVPLAEGVERIEEHDACRQLGFRLGQGFYYGRPAPARVCASPESR